MVLSTSLMRIKTSCIVTTTLPLSCKTVIEYMYDNYIIIFVFVFVFDRNVASDSFVRIRIHLLILTLDYATVPAKATLAKKFGLVFAILLRQLLHGPVYVNKYGVIAKRPECFLPTKILINRAKTMTFPGIDGFSIRHELG